MKFSRPLVLWLVVVGLAGAQAPINDNCIGATGLEVGINPAPPYGASGALFSNVGAALPPSGPFSGFGGFNDVFFSLEATCTGTLRVSMCTPPGFAAGTLTGAILTVFASGSCSGAPQPVSTPDVACAGARPQVTFPATEGGIYLVRVAGLSLSQGTFHLTVLPTSAAAADECATATALAAGPNAGSTQCATASGGAFLAACGTPPAIMGDVWHTVVAPFDATATITLTGAGADDFAVYSGTCGSLNVVACSGAGSPRTATFAAPAGSTHYVRVWKTLFAAGQHSYQLDVAFGGQPASDACATATPVFAGVNPAPPSGFGGATFSNAGATDEPGFADPCGSGGHQDVFFVYASDVDGPVRVSTCTPAGFAPGSLADTMVSIYASGDCGAPSPAALACNDDACEPYRSDLVFNATYGATYLIRVSSYYVGVTGSFYLTIDPSLNESCSAATPITPGVVHGTTAVPPCVGCTQVWYAFTPAIICDVSIAAAGAAPSVGFDVFLTPDCANFTLVSGFASEATLTGVAPGTTLWIRVITGAPGAFDLAVTCPTPPPNDDPAGAIPLVETPSATTGVGSIVGNFHNFGATQSAGFATTSDPACGTPGRGPRSDVFFSYATAFDGPVVLEASQILGLPAPALDSIVEIYAFVGTGYAVLACNDDAAPGVASSSVRFDAVAGTSYLIRVATSWVLGSTAPGEHTTEGAFQIRVTRPFAFDIDAPLGAGSVRLRNVNGPPFTAALTVLTLFPGNFPHGFFYGIDPTYAELQLALTYGAPFINLLDANGASSFVAGPGLPSFTLYGVTLLLNALGQPVAVSAPESFTIP
jgi:hypothetical protein